MEERQELTIPVFFFLSLIKPSVFSSGPRGSRQRSQRASIRHSSDLRLWGRGIPGRQPQLHRLRQLGRRPGLRLPQQLGTTLSETGQHVWPTLSWTAPPPPPPTERSITSSWEYHRSCCGRYFLDTFDECFLSRTRFEVHRGKRNVM